MKVVVEAAEKRYRRLVPEIKKTALKLARFLRLGRLSVEIYLVGNGFMRKNVLAFPFPKRFPGPKTLAQPLGEVYLNPGYIKKRGENLTYLLIHGLLHLLGYDHKRNNDTIIMQKKENELLRKL